MRTTRRQAIVTLSLLVAHRAAAAAHGQAPTPRPPNVPSGGGFSPFRQKGFAGTSARYGAYLRSLDNPTAEPRRLVGTDHAARYASGHLLFLEGTTLMAQPFDAERAVLSGTATPLVRGVGGSSNGYSAFSVSATGVLAYAGPTTALTELRWIDRSGRPAEVVAPEADYVDFRLSNDRSRLAYARVDPQTGFPDVFILDLARAITTRITSERSVQASSVWSPDDRQLAFRSNRGKSSGNDLFITTAAPGGVVSDLYGGGGTGTIIPCFWMPDGRLVFYQVVTTTLANGYGIWSVDVATRTSQVILDTPANELQAALSPNGRWMAYASDRSGRYEIYVLDFEAGTTLEQVSTNGGAQPQWRADGRELFYLQSDGALMVVTIAAGDRFASSAAKPLFETPLPSVLNPYRMDYVPAADGQRFLMKMPSQTARRPAITVVLNWPALLRRSGASLQ